MKNILFVLLIFMAGSIKAQVPVKSDGSQPGNAGIQRNEALSSGSQGKANQGSALLPMKMADGAARTAKPAALPLKAPGGTTKDTKATALPIKPGGGNVTSAKAAAIVPLRTADNAAKKL